MKHLIYTSARRGLLTRSAGFCTVAMSPGIPPLLRESIENISGFRSEGADIANQANIAHLTIRTQDGSRHIVSRIAPCAPDYSGRSNTIAHHMVLDEAESLSFDPLAFLGHDIRFHENWSGEPCELEPTPCAKSASIPPAPCKHWERFTGDAGNAGVVWAAIRDLSKTVAVLLPRNTDRVALVRELLALVPLQFRREITFSTGAGADGSPDVTCILRLRIDCQESRDELASLRGATILDFTNRPGAPSTSEASQARAGTIFSPPITAVTEHKPARNNVFTIASDSSPSHSLTKPVTGTGRQRRTTEELRSESKRHPVLIAVAFLGAIVSGAAMTLFIQLVIPRDTQSIAAPIKAGATNDVDASKAPPAPSPTTALIEERESKISKLTRELEQLRQETQRSREMIANLQQEATKLTTVLPESTRAPSTAESKPPEPAVEAPKPERPVQLQCTNQVEPPSRFHVARTERAERIELPGFHHEEAVRIAVVGGASNLELIPSSDPNRVTLRSKSPSKSVADPVATLSLFSGSIPALHIDWATPSRASALANASIVLMGSDVVSVSLTPPQSLSLELQVLRSGAWRSQLKSKSERDLVERILRRSDDASACITSPESIIDHAYWLKIVEDNGQDFLVIEAVSKRAFVPGDETMLDAVQNRVNSIWNMSNELAARVNDENDKRKLLPDQFRARADELKSEINQLKQQVDTAASVLPAANALQDYYKNNAEWIIPSRSGNEQLVLRMHTGAK